MTEQTTPPTMEETMAAAYDKMNAAPEVAEKPEEKPQINEKEAVEGSEEKETPAEEETPDQGNEEEANPAEVQQPIEPPSRWSAERKAKFAALPRDAQEILLERESEVDKRITQKSQELAEQKRTYESLERVVAPRRHVAAMNGLSVEQEIAQLFTLSDYANSDPVGFIKRFASDRGIALSQLNQQGGAELHPALAATQKSLKSIEDRLNAGEAEREAQENQRWQDAVETFKADPKNKYFDDVRTDMAKIVEAGLAGSIEDAYKKACRSNEHVYSRILAEERKAEEAKRIEEAKKAAAQAKKAAGTNLSGKSSLPANPGKRSIEETMSDTYDRMMGAA